VKNNRLVGFVRIVAICTYLGAVSGSSATAGDAFTGSIGSFTRVLDADYPDDHLDFAVSRYSSEVDRVVRAARLSIAQIMLLDEVLQAGEDDRACSAVSARGSASYLKCTSGLYRLPSILEHLKVDNDCRSSLAPPERVTCLLLLETLVRNRRAVMQTHPTWVRKQLELDKALAKSWLENGQPAASEWHVYPVALEIAKLDSLLIYVLALDVATSVQAAEMYDVTLAISDPYVLGVRAKPPFPKHDLANRRALVQSARNRLIASWKTLARVEFGSSQRGASWKSNYRSWIYDARFGVSGFGMSLARPAVFNLRPLQSIPIPESAEKIGREESTRADTPAKKSSVQRSSRHSTSTPVFWVRGGVPIRIPPSQQIQSTGDHGEPVGTIRDKPKPGVAPPTPPVVLQTPIPRIELQKTKWPDVLVPKSIAECKLRWEPFRCVETSEEDVLAYAAEAANDTFGTAAFVAQAAPIKGVRVVAKRLAFILPIAECSAHWKKGDILAAFGACMGAVFVPSPQWEKDLPGHIRRFESSRDEARARQVLREFDEIMGGQREFERNYIASSELRDMATPDRSP
jgi:hypothetical protein